MAEIFHLLKTNSKDLLTDRQDVMEDFTKKPKQPGYSTQQIREIILSELKYFLIKGQREIESKKGRTVCTKQQSKPGKQEIWLFEEHGTRDDGETNSAKRKKIIMKNKPTNSNLEQDGVICIPRSEGGNLATLMKSKEDNLRSI